MTSEPGVEPVAERFLYHCCCGAEIETSSLCEICWSCGKTIELIRCVPTPDGKKYKLRISRHPLRAAAESFLWPSTFPAPPRPKPAVRRELFGAVPDPGRRRRYSSRDYSNHFTLVGLLILLAPVYLPLLLFCINFVAATPQRDQSSERVIRMPQPTDCGPFSNCHYEERVVHVNSKSAGPYTVIEWKRVND